MNNTYIVSHILNILCVYYIVIYLLVHRATMMRWRVVDDCIQGRTYFIVGFNLTGYIIPVLRYSNLRTSIFY